MTDDAPVIPEGYPEPTEWLVFSDPDHPEQPVACRIEDIVAIYPVTIAPAPPAPNGTVAEHARMLASILFGNGKAVFVRETPEECVDRLTHALYPDLRKDVS